MIFRYYMEDATYMSRLLVWGLSYAITTNLLGLHPNLRNTVDEFSNKEIIASKALHSYFQHIFEEKHGNKRQLRLYLKAERSDFKFTG